MTARPDPPFIGQTLAWTAADGTCATAPTSVAGIGGVAPYWTTYEYDPLGNRTKKTEHDGTAAITTSYTHGGAGPHQLTSMTTTTGGASTTTELGWDDAGHQTTRSVDGQTIQTQTWDAEGELTSVAKGEDTTSNVYDADGNRLVRFDLAGATVYLPGGQEIHATTEKVTATRWYTFAGTTVGVRTGTGMGGVASIVTDAHGTPVAYIHNTDWAASVKRIRTDPFGAARTDQTGAVEGHGYLGAPADDTGLSLLGARYYDPGTGTFLSPDPLLDPMLPAQFNAYVYSANNPVTWSDASGLLWGPGTQMDPDHPNPTVFQAPVKTLAPSSQTSQASSPSAPSATTPDPVTFAGLTGEQWGGIGLGVLGVALVALGMVCIVGTAGICAIPIGIGGGGAALAGGGAIATGATVAISSGAAGTAVIAGGVVATGAAGHIVYNESASEPSSASAQASSGNANLTTSQQRSLSSLRRQLDAHRNKLEAYRANPEAYDNLGLLERVSPEIRQQIIDGRVRHLETEIRTFQNQITKLLGGD